MRLAGQIGELGRLPERSLSRFAELGLVAGLVVVAGTGWALTVDRMRGMDTGPGSDLGSVGWFGVAWLLMTIAMMLPSIAPMVLASARTVAGRSAASRSSPLGATVAFVTGYLLPWIAAGLLAYVVVEGVRSLEVGFLGWGHAGRYVAGGVIAGAALYQLSRLKDVCLRHCRTPSLLLHDGGRGGALRVGVAHGVFCVGCCWALMAALFALGVMSIAWMAFVAALIGVEKLLPPRAVANRGIALLLVVLGLGVAFAPHHVPGLTIPGNSSRMMMTGD
jgi:predicted metal-binding membrane protein